MLFSRGAAQRLSVPACTLQLHEAVAFELNAEHGHCTGPLYGAGAGMGDEGN